MLKRPRHGVLPADGGNPQFMLCAKRAEKRCKWLAPLLRIGAEPLEILLQCKAHLARLAACRNDLRHGLDNGIDCSVERTPR